MGGQCRLVVSVAVSARGQAAPRIAGAPLVSSDLFCRPEELLVASGPSATRRSFEGAIHSKKRPSEDGRRSDLVRTRRYRGNPAIPLIRPYGIFIGYVRLHDFVAEPPPA